MLLYKQPLTLVHQKYSFRIADLVCYQQKNLSKLWLETFTTTAFQYRLMKEMSLFRDKLSVQSNHSCMYYVVLRMILQLYKSILTSTKFRPFFWIHLSCATDIFYHRIQLTCCQNLGLRNHTRLPFVNSRDLTLGAILFLTNCRVFILINAFEIGTSILLYFSSDL